MYEVGDKIETTAGMIFLITAKHPDGRVMSGNWLITWRPDGTPISKEHAAEIGNIVRKVEQ